jgi:hypothetical protein
MDETKNSGDSTSDKQSNPFEQQPRTLLGTKRQHEEHETVQRPDNEQNTERKPFPMPPEIEELISTTKRFLAFVRDHKNFNAFVVVLTCVIAIATIAQGVVSYLQWSTGSRNADIAERQLRNSEAAQGANLVIENVQEGINRGSNGMLFIKGQYTLHNLGQTAAEHIAGSMTGGVRIPRTKFPCNAVAHNIKSPFSLPINAKEEHSFSGGTGDPQDISKIAKGDDKRIFIYDQFSYFDIFGNPKSVSVCREWSGEIGFQSCFPDCE